ncbi:MAG: lysoplasmalogenase family protein [Candidatus Hodarchaeota archaeon]
MQRKNLLLVYLIAIFTLVCELCRQILFVVTSEVYFPFFLAASISISFAAVIFRLFIIDPEKFTSVILETDIYGSNENSSDQSLNPVRFLNLMPIAMVTCSIADFLITIEFIAGVLTFFVAQILYIGAYSGIIHLNPKMLFTGKAKSLTFGSIIVWVFIAGTLYITLIYSPADIMTLFVIPYVIVLTLMVIVTFFGFGYIDRSIKFRLMLCGGGILFLVSDTILAYNRFNTTFYGAGIWIGASYLLAVFMLQYAMLCLRAPDGSSILISSSS